METIRRIVLILVIAVCTGGILASLPAVLRALADPQKDYFVGALLPVILGLCAEGLLFVGVLEGLQASAEERRLRVLHAALMAELGFLAEVMRNCLLNSKANGIISAHLQSSQEISEAMESERIKVENARIEGGYGDKSPDSFSWIAKSVSEEVIQKAQVHLRRLQNVAPVAAQIGGDFLTRWLAVTDRLFDLTQVEPFSQGQIEAFGERMPWEYTYARVVDLFRELGALRVRFSYDKGKGFKATVNSAAHSLDGFFGLLPLDAAMLLSSISSLMFGIFTFSVMSFWGWSVRIPLNYGIAGCAVCLVVVLAGFLIARAIARRIAGGFRSTS